MNKIAHFCFYFFILFYFTKCSNVLNQKKSFTIIYILLRYFI